MVFFAKTEGKKQQATIQKNRFKLPKFKHRQILTGTGLLQVPLKNKPLQFLEFSLYIG